MWFSKKGRGKVMKDYQGAISRIIDEYIPISYNSKPMNQQTEDALLLQELVDEKIEQESRKDKLIVGSEWECVALCLVAEISSKGKLTSILTVLGVVCTFIGNDDFMSTIKVKDKHYVIPTEQFLLCFKPIGEVKE